MRLQSSLNCTRTQAALSRYERFIGPAAQGDLDFTDRIVIFVEFVLLPASVLTDFVDVCDKPRDWLCP
jgi:hypothetical protein